MGDGAGGRSERIGGVAQVKSRTDGGVIGEVGPNAGPGETATQEQGGGVERSGTDDGERGFDCPTGSDDPPAPSVGTDEQPLHEGVSENGQVRTNSSRPEVGLVGGGPVCVGVEMEGGGPDARSFYGGASEEG